MEERIVDANGLGMNVVLAGRGPPLLLLHGWPEFVRVWRKLIPLLERDFRIIAPDFRGFGGTRKPPSLATERVTAKVLGDDMVALLAALGVSEPVGIVSHDVGAQVAQDLARRPGLAISGLFFFNCPYPGIGSRWCEPGHLKEIWYQSFHQLPVAAPLVGASRDSIRTYFRWFLEHWSGDPRAFDDDLEAWIDNFARPGNLQGGFDWYVGNGEARLAAMRGEVPPLPPITVPTRVLWGERDPVLPSAWMDRLPDVFTDLHATVARDAGHFVHFERPDLSGREIKVFFDKVAERHAASNG